MAEAATTASIAGDPQTKQAMGQIINDLHSPPRGSAIGLFVPLLLLLLAVPVAAHRAEGTVSARVTSADGQPLPARICLVAQAGSFDDCVETAASGEATFHRVPFGIVHIRAAADGFETLRETINVRSEVPLTWSVQLGLAVNVESVTVSAPPVVVDEAEPALALTASGNELRTWPAALPGRDVIDVVDSMPGWLLEANAVLHPRGSEYDTQYVIDGMPLYDNRSIGFVPPFSLEDVEAVTVVTGGFGAQYGRRMGGVIELHPRRNSGLGHRGSVMLGGGSYRTRSGSIRSSYSTRRSAFQAAFRGAGTDRYLDPPSLENFTNHGTDRSGELRFERDLRPTTRLSLSVRNSEVRFGVPNTFQQQEEGQRQDRAGVATAGQVHIREVVGPRSIFAVRAMLRDVDARLWSNPLSTPVIVEQDRGMRQGAVNLSYVRDGVSGTTRFGGDIRVANVREQFALEPAEAGEAFDFTERRQSEDYSLYAERSFRWRALSVNAGVRLDKHRFLISRSGLTPRLAAAYTFGDIGLQLRASYDRVFQTPPMENLLLSNSARVLALDQAEGLEPVPVSRGNFWEFGLRQSVGKRMRFDITRYRRGFNNYYDDDVFLNTGIGLPIAFDGAEIEGTEIRVEVPRWGRFSGYASWSNMLGTASSPVTGGLFLEGGEAEELRDVATTFPISQDQRNTLRTALRWQALDRVSFGVRFRYGSGLPVEFEDDDDDDDIEELRFPPVAFDDDDDDEEPVPDNIARRVNFERGRVRPNFAVDFSARARVWEAESRYADLQLDVKNAADRLNVVNFTGLFSGTSIAPGRLVNLRLRVGF